MSYVIKKYPVQHPLLKKYIRFFWEIHAGHMQLNHKLIPQRNITLKFNLNETPHSVHLTGEVHSLENVYFSGMQDHFINAQLEINGQADVLGVCFFSDGFYPFLKVPVSEFKNQLIGVREAGLKHADAISQQLKEAPDVVARLAILERELVRLLSNDHHIPEAFRRLFNTLKQNNNPLQIAQFCQQENIGVRTLERMYNKYIGVSAMTYGTINRFHGSMNQLLCSEYSRLSDLAYDNGYFDQMHFIKEFKRFAGNTPKNFVHQNNSILQIAKFA